MSGAYLTGSVADGIIAAIKNAWVPTYVSTLTIQEDTEPKTIQDLWFVNLRALEVRSDPRGPNASVVTVDDLYRYEIVLYFPMPAAQGNSSGKVARLKSTYATALRSQLQSGADFVGVANLPYVTGLDYKNHNPPFEGAEMLRMIFECHGESAH